MSLGSLLQDIFFIMASLRIFVAKLPSKHRDLPTKMAEVLVPLQERRLMVGFPTL